MQFTSGTQALQGRTVNHDSERFARPGTHKRYSYPRWPNCYQDPRPEFAVLDNPILAELRDGYAATGRADYRRSLVQMQLGALAFGEWSGVTTHAERVHARRVLTLLAALAE